MSFILKTFSDLQQRSTIILGSKGFKCSWILMCNERYMRWMFKLSPHIQSHAYITSYTVNTVCTLHHILLILYVHYIIFCSVHVLCPLHHILLIMYAHDIISFDSVCTLHLSCLTVCTLHHILLTLSVHYIVSC